MESFVECSGVFEEYHENVAYIESEAICPFCEISSWMHIESDDEGVYYKCGVCGSEWSVIEE